MDTFMGEKSLILINSLKILAERRLHKHNKRIKEKYCMLEKGDLEIEGCQEKCRNSNLPHMQKGEITEPLF
jgi:hypothetical protein